MNSSALVTGAAGFIGSHVCDHLVNAGFMAVALDDLWGGFKKNVNLKAIFVKGSVTDNLLIDCLFEEYQFKYVYIQSGWAQNHRTYRVIIGQYTTAEEAEQYMFLRSYDIAKLRELPRVSTTTWELGVTETIEKLTSPTCHWASPDVDGGQMRAQPK